MNARRVWLFVTAALCVPLAFAVGVPATSAGAATAASVATIDRLPDDLLADWQPDDTWTLTGTSSIGTVDAARCPVGVATDWAGTDGEAVHIFWMGCTSPEVAFQVRDEKWGAWSDRANTAGLPYAFGAQLDVVSTFTDAAGTPGVARSWVQESVYVNVQRTCPRADIETCTTSTAEYSREIAAILPGQVREDTTGMELLKLAGILLFGFPLAIFLVLVLPQRILSWARSRGYATAPDDRNFTAVDRLVRRVLAVLVLRRVILTVSVVVAYFYLLFALMNAGLWLLAFALVGPFALYAVFGLVLRLVWRPHPLLGMARARIGRPTMGGVVGSLLRGAAHALAGMALVFYAFATIQLLADRGSTRVTVDEGIEADRQSGAFLAVYAEFRRAVSYLDRSGNFGPAFLGILLAVFAGYLLDRLGQRVARNSLQATLQNDTRPYFLYLRGFDEDRLRIRNSVSRKGFLELLTPFGRPRFEEVLVRYLSLFGPVIAISPRRQRLADLGAAKISVNDDAWQEQVREWVAGARAVVMAGTPAEVRPGLEWEMDHIANRADELRLMIVVAPWPRAELARRWGAFRARAAQWPLFAPLGDSPPPSGVHILTWSAATGWRGYGARRRWDWTYAASIITALKSGELDAPAAQTARPPDPPTVKVPV
ncbi:hypothetical protein QMG61_01275 [Cryobacterium sp. PH31-AA6]|uniref:hypothetical protein n=1 Tax=Cryobacterium sp. PH31-AA6 TaxID=3046205 RepID=UPI0024BAFBEF|nr:hypothetical protein [Cryobacterium sp. PH31-AA6]MDJ0322395.1 hypothetical protein [Cryobacterium sp. PH31-AA6]